MDRYINISLLETHGCRRLSTRSTATKYVYKYVYAVDILEKIHTFLIHFKETGFSTSLVAAKDLAEELEMSPDDMVITAEGSIRRRQRRKQFS